MCTRASIYMDIPIYRAYSIYSSYPSVLYIHLQTKLPVAPFR